MGTGHNRVPAAVKKLRGTVRKDRANARAPLASPKMIPKPPRGLTPVQVRVWRELAPQVEHLGVFSKSDLTSFRLLVCVVAETRDKAFKLEKGTARVRMLQAASSLLQSFGLSPASRERVSVQGPAADVEQPEQDETPLFGAGLRAIEGGAKPATPPPAPEVKSG